MTEIRPADGGPHDEVHTAVRALLARRPYTAQDDALVTLLHRLADRHQVPMWPDPDRRCSCGARIHWGDVLADEPCPEMAPVIALAAAIVEDDRSELVDHGVTYAAYGASWGGGE